MYIGSGEAIIKPFFFEQGVCVDIVNGPQVYRARKILIDPKTTEHVKQVLERFGTESMRLEEFPKDVQYIITANVDNVPNKQTDLNSTITHISIAQDKWVVLPSKETDIHPSRAPLCFYSDPFYALEVALLMLRQKAIEFRPKDLLAFQRLDEEYLDNLADHYLFSRYKVLRYFTNACPRCFAQMPDDKGLKILKFHIDFTKSKDHFPYSLADGVRHVTERMILAADDVVFGCPLCGADNIVPDDLSWLHCTRNPTSWKKYLEIK